MNLKDLRMEVNLEKIKKDIEQLEWPIDKETRDVIEEYLKKNNLAWEEIKENTELRYFDQLEDFLWIAWAKRNKKKDIAFLKALESEVKGYTLYPLRTAANILNIKYETLKKQCARGKRDHVKLGSGKRTTILVKIPNSETAKS